MTGPCLYHPDRPGAWLLKNDVMLCDPCHYRQEGGAYQLKQAALYLTMVAGLREALGDAAGAAALRSAASDMGSRAAELA